MAKKKFSLTEDLVTNSKEIENLNTKTNVNEEQKVNITINMTLFKRNEIKTWCAKNNVSVSEAFKKGFELFKNSN